jgi:hypothetical protein
VLLPRAMPTSVPRKKQVLASRIRTLALCAFLLVLFAVVMSRQKRRARRRAVALDQELPDLAAGPIAVSVAAAAVGIPSHVSVGAHARTGDEAPADEGGGALSAPSDSDAVDGGDGDAAAGGAAGAAAPSDRGGEPALAPYGVLSQQIESYSRTDVPAGARPVCRISDACILANGMVSLPAWMSKEDRLLRRCGLGPHTFHTGEDGPKGSPVKRVDADLAQLIRLMRFKEPSGTLAEFFAESVLHAAYVFDTFGGGRGAAAAETESHCIATQNGTECDQQARESGAAAAAAAAGLKPGLFVPKRVRSQEDTWEAHALGMLDGKYGPAAVAKVATEDVLNEAEKGRTSNVSATCFRSIIVSEAKFRDLPTGAFGAATSAFFAKGAVDRTPRVRGRADVTGACSVTVGILKKAGVRAVQPIDALRERITSIASAALPTARVAVDVIEHSREVPFPDQVSRMRDVDIVVGGTSNSLSSMAFMRSGSAVFEVFPFAWQPPFFEDLSRVLGHRHHAVHASPQTTEFKTCLEHELFQLRKQNRLQGDESPDWVRDAEARWEQASGEFALSGQSPLLLNSDASGVSNFHTRTCARHQSLDFNVDDVAKAVLLEARDICQPAAA